jgi:hypothetical protein
LVAGKLASAMAMLCPAVPKAESKTRFLTLRAAQGKEGGYNLMNTS